MNTDIVPVIGLRVQITDEFNRVPFEAKNNQSS